MLIGTKLSPNWHERQFSITFLGGREWVIFSYGFTSARFYTSENEDVKMFPKKGTILKRRFHLPAFQPSIFGGYLSFQGGNFTKNMHRKSALVSSNLSFPNWFIGIYTKNIEDKNYLNETEWNHLDFRKTPRKKKTTPPKTQKPRYGRRFPSTELTELPLPLERSNFTSGHSSVYSIAQVKKQEPIRKGFKVVSGSLLVASEGVLMNLYVYCTGGRAKCYPSSQWTLGNFFHCWSVLILYRFCWVYPSCF